MVIEVKLVREQTLVSIALTEWHAPMGLARSAAFRR